MLYFLRWKLKMLNKLDLLYDYQSWKWYSKSCTGHHHSIKTSFQSQILRIIES